MMRLYVDGAAIAYRLYDIGYSIRLDDAAALLAANIPERARPARVEAQALQIANPPVDVPLGTEQLQVDGTNFTAELSARLYDFGVCALRLQVQAPSRITWEEYFALGRALDSSPRARDAFQRALDRLAERLRPAIERPGIAPVSEEYAVFRVTRLSDDAGNTLTPDVLDDDHLVPLLLGETRPLAGAARRELLTHRFSYFAEDLTVLSWDNALVIDSNANDRDVEYVLEFANAQLLELRFYDAQLDAELPAMYDRVAGARVRRIPILARRYPILAELHTRVADVTETVERVDNALKVTDDVYLARIYSAALELFRGQTWRRGIERKLGIFRESYAMLNAESQASRAEVLEFAIVLLIVFEIVLSFWRA